MPVLQIKTTPKIRRGPETYKLNNSILRLNFVKDEIQYIWQIHEQSKIFFPDSNEWWEKGKQLLSNALKNLSIEINKSHHQIKNKILELLNDNSNFNVVAIASFKEKLAKLYERKYKECRIRAKIQKLKMKLQTKLSIKKKKNKEKRIL